jgi:hypothetical protein
MELALDRWLPGGFAGSVCICLDESTWRATKARLAATFPHTVSFPAVDLRDLLKHGVAAAVRTLRALPFPVTTQVMYDVCTRKSFKFLEHIVTPGAVGCAQSHFQIWAAFLNGELARALQAGGGQGRSDADWLLVFESDVDPVKNCEALLRALVSSPRLDAVTASQTLPSIIRLGWSVVKSGTQTPTVHAAFNTFGGQSWCTHAYFVRKSAIPACLAALVPLASQIDTALGHASDLGLIPTQWIARQKLFGQQLRHTLLNSTVRQNHLLRAALPESAAATEAIIIVPYALVLLLIIALVVSVVVLGRKKKQA